jgi:hypothetical protein
MTDIKIEYNPSVYDDPDYCETERGKCFYCKGEYCGLTGDYLKLNQKTNQRMKHGGCEADWINANAERPPKTLPKGHRLG